MKKYDRKGFENHLTKWCHSHGFYWQHSAEWEPSEEATEYSVYTHTRRGLFSGDQKRILTILNMVM